MEVIDYIKATNAKYLDYLRLQAKEWYYRVQLHELLEKRHASFVDQIKRTQNTNDPVFNNYMAIKVIDAMFAISMGQCDVMARLNNNTYYLNIHKSPPALKLDIYVKAFERILAYAHNEDAIYSKHGNKNPIHPFSGRSQLAAPSLEKMRPFIFNFVDLLIA